MQGGKRILPRGLWGGILAAALLAGCVEMPMKVGGGSAKEIPPAPAPSGTAPAAQPAEPESGSCVRAQWAQEVLTGLSDYERFRLGLDEEQPLIWFSAERAVTDFQVLTLALESIDEDGNARFVIEEVYTHGALTPEVPLLVRMELMGTIPNNGISYVDADGQTRYFTLGVSGYDGSLLLTAFTPCLPQA